MATLPKEQVGYHTASAKHDVGVTLGDPSDGQDTSTGFRAWLATVVEPYTVTNTTAVSASRDTLSEVVTAFDTVNAGDATSYNLYTSEGIGEDSGA